MNQFELVSQYDIKIICNDYDRIMNPDHTASIVVADNFITLNLEVFFIFLFFAFTHYMHVIIF